jgi:rhodanese-related sulfurtransferase
MMGIEKRKKKLEIVDTIVIGIVLLLAFFFYNNYRQFAKSATLDPNFIKGAPDVNAILIDRIKNSPLSPEFIKTNPIHMIKTFGFHAANILTQIPFIDSIYHFVNKNQGFVHECNNDGQFVDSSVPKIRYPLDITNKELRQKIKDYPELMIVDVREESKYLKGHIPGSVSLPVFVLVDQIYHVNRWTEIVVVGDSYLQTKLASEALLRLNFQRLHRLIMPVEKWGKDLVSFE